MDQFHRGRQELMCAACAHLSGFAASEFMPLAEVVGERREALQAQRGVFDDKIAQGRAREAALHARREECAARCSEAEQTLRDGAEALRAHIREQEQSVLAQLAALEQRRHGALEAECVAVRAAVSAWEAEAANIARVLDSNGQGAAFLAASVQKLDELKQAPPDVGVLEQPTLADSSCSVPVPVALQAATDLALANPQTCKAELCAPCLRIQGRTLHGDPLPPSAFLLRVVARENGKASMLSARECLAHPPREDGTISVSFRQRVAQAEVYLAPVSGQHEECFGGPFDLDHQLYLMGEGYKGNAVRIFDIHSHAWSQGPAMNHARDYGAAVVYQNAIYVMGSCYTPHKLSVERLDPHSGRWNFVKAMPKERYCFAASVVADSIYTVGHSADTDVVQRYVLDRDEWIDAPHLPVPVSSPATASIGHSLFSMGNGFTTEPRDCVYQLDVRTPNWLVRASMGTARGRHAAVATEDAIYVTGGKSTLNSAEKYDVRADRWAPIASPTQSRQAHAMAHIGNSIYAIGGKDSNTIEVYDIQRDRWNPVTEMEAAFYGKGAVAL